MLPWTKKVLQNSMTSSTVLAYNNQSFVIISSSLKLMLIGNYRLPIGNERLLIGNEKLLIDN